MNYENDLFTVDELAGYLRIKPITIYKYASSGRLPGFRVGTHWRFKKSTIDAWISRQELSSVGLFDMSTTVEKNG